jgi:hypothetical protein
MFSGRSYWMLRYTDGRIVSEADVDWSLAPQKGRQALRLYCPNGHVVELGSGDCTGRLFQLKVAALKAGVGRAVLAHVIGLVNNGNGDCQYAAWDYERGALVTGTDNVFAMKYHQIGRLAFDHLGMNE